MGEVYLDEDGRVVTHGEPERPSDDPLATRGDIGMGYYQARATLAATFPIHDRLWAYPRVSLRDAISACADAFAAFVLHQHAAVVKERDDLSARLATVEAERDDAYWVIARDHAKRAKDGASCNCVICEHFRATHAPTPGDTP